MRDGYQMTLREMLQEPNLNKQVARGKVELIRNRPEDVMDAHQEMIRHISDTYVIDPATEDLKQRLMSIYSEFEDCIPFPLPGKFLLQHQYLLD